MPGGAAPLGDGWNVCGVVWVGSLVVVGRDGPVGRLGNR